MTTIDRRNEQARTRAQEAGREHYNHEVVDTWPACTTCATTIRNRAGDDHRDRSCGCPGVTWRCGLDGWRRWTPGPVPS